MQITANMRHIALLCILVFGLAVSCTADVYYRMTDLAIFNDVYSISASDINNSGMIVGSADNKAFTWVPGQGVRYLDSLPGFENNAATAVNDNGQIVGYVEHSGYLSRACLWDIDKSVSSLGALPSGEFNQSSRAYDINELGLVVGSSTSAKGFNHAFVWDKTTGMEDLTGAEYIGNSSANAINDNGTIVGQSHGYAYIWNGTNDSHYLDQTDTRLRTASDINNSGQVICQNYSTTSIGYGYFWGNDGNGSRQVNPLSSNGYSSITSINNMGQAVGESDSKAIIWDSLNGTQELPTTMPNSLRACAGAINDNGVIAGYVMDASYKVHLVTWSPVPEPSCIVTLALGLVSASIGGISQYMRCRK